jgi:membrane fusion protein (multidrug efflux system)
MSKQMVRMLIIVGIVFGLIFGFYGLKKILFLRYLLHYTPPPVTISASTAKTVTWQSYLSSVGTLVAINGVEITSEVAGIVKEIHFSSGQFVKKNDLLVLLDTRVENAQLKNDEAKLNLSQLNYNRNLTLAKKNVASQSTLDTTRAELLESQAALESTQARIQQKTIVAPFDGRIGIRLINIGEYVSAGTPMVSLQSLDPLYVQFNLPEQFLSLLYIGQPIDVIVNQRKNKVIKGTISAINSKVDQVTRNILVQGTISNQNMELYPGMFAAIKVWLKQQKNTVILPQTAISYSLHGDAVYIIKEEKDSSGKPILRAYRQYVKIGERREAEAAILDGIKAGDQVVTSGQLKLQNGTHVVIDNSVEL